MEGTQADGIVHSLSTGNQEQREDNAAGTIRSSEKHNRFRWPEWSEIMGRRASKGTTAGLPRVMGGRDHLHSWNMIYESGDQQYVYCLCIECKAITKMSNLEWIVFTSAVAEANRADAEKARQQKTLG